MNDNMLSAGRPILWGWGQEVCGSGGRKANCFKGLVKLLAELEIMLIQGGDDFRRSAIRAGNTSQEGFDDFLP